MALKYFVKYKDVVDIEHVLNIFDDNFTGNATRVGGRVFLDHGEVDKTLECIRGQGLRVELEANSGLTFDDLFSEEERVINCQYSRDGIILFNGWLNPEGFFEDFVQSDWIVSFDCVDGLSYLTDLSFVDENGFKITGRKKYIEILSIALKRTGLNLKINTDIRIRYDGLDPLLDPLDNVFANTARYVEEDNDTITDCEKVIRDILEPFTACISLFNNEWYIYKPNQLFSDQTADFFSYDADGVFIEKKTLDTSTSIGSQLNGFSPHHCSANQSITNKASLGAYRVNYKYGLVQSLIDNTDLFSADGVSIADFKIYTPNDIDALVSGESGVTINARNTGSTPPVNQIRTSKIINVTPNIASRISIKDSISVGDLGGSGTYVNTSLRYQIILSEDTDIDSGSGDIFYLNKRNFSEWLTNRQTIEVNVGRIFENTTRNLDIDVNIPPIPDGYPSLNLFVRITVPYYDIIPSSPLPYEVKHSINFLSISPANQADVSGVVGEFHTVQRLDKPSAKVDEVKKVLTGDNPSDFYEGTIYKSDAETPTSIWAREGFVEEKPLLQIMVEDTARNQQATAREFSGDVFGYYPYISVISIDGLAGLFMPIKYEYDTKENIISGTFRQIFANEVADLEYKPTNDFGNTVKPTIKG